MDTQFQRAVESRGTAYLNAESQLLTAGVAAKDTLVANLAHLDPFVRAMVNVLLAWSQAAVPEYQAALDYLDAIAKRMERTVLGTPPPIGVANELSERFGPKVADLLALRLAKATDWPRWRRIGVLLYLQQHKRPSTTAALLRFAAETDNDEDRSYALDAIRAIADPELRAKLDAELAHQRANQRGLPAELSGLVR